MVCFSICRDEGFTQVKSKGPCSFEKLILVDLEKNGAILEFPSRTRQEGKKKRLTD